MTHRRPTIWFPIVSLLVAVILVTHDAGMAAGLRHPHDHGARHNPASEVATDHADRDHHPAARHLGTPSIPPDAASHAPTDQELQCVSFEAARPNDRLPGLEMPAAVVLPLATLPETGTPIAWSADAAPGAPPGQLRALLQVWLI
jgi:hypothetical protein